jgi:hypothetical protein
MNPIIGETPLKLSDGRRFTLIADNAGLAKAAQAHTGATKVHRLFADLQPRINAKGEVEVDEFGDPVKDTLPATAALLFGLLDARHPQVTQRDAMNMVLAETDAVSEALSAAIQLAFPDAAEGKKGANPPRRTGRGKTSGGSGAKRA